MTPLPNGALDPDFGSGGKVTTGVPGGATAMALQADGKVVVVGGRTLARYNVDGTLDAGFGSGGQVSIVFNGGLLDTAQALAIQPDGRIVVAGFTRVGAQDDFAVARYDTDGSPDESFGSGGKVSTDFNGAVDRAFAVLVQPDGGIVLAGHAATSTPLGPDNDFAIARYTSAGDLDASFGTGGKVTTNIGGRTDLAAAAVLQGDGGIVVAGRVADSGGDNPDVGIVRYLANGSLDPAFGTGGIVRRDFTANWDEAADVTIQTDGKIVVAVEAVIGSSFAFAVARFEANGSIDSAFGSSGLATTAFSTMQDFPRAVTVQADGKIVVVGQSSNFLNSDVAIARFNQDGTLDGAFGSGGKVTVDVFGASDGGECVAIQGDGKIVVGGFARNGTSTGVVLTRIVP